MSVSRSWVVEIDDSMSIAIITSVKLRGNFGNGTRTFYPGQRVLLTVDVTALGLVKGDEVVIQSLSIPGGGRKFIQIGPVPSGQKVDISHLQVAELPQSVEPALPDSVPHDCSAVEEPEPAGYGLV